MKTQKIVLLATLLAVLAWDMQKPVWSCGGTPVPNCGRTMWLALLTPRNIVFRAGVPIQVPVGVMPYLFWNVNAPCAQPAVGASAPGVSTPASIFNNASLIINVTCTPLGGSPVQLGPFIYNFDLPAMPGIQPNDSVSFDVPAGTFDGSVPVICDVSGTYAVDFTNGTGAGMLSASNQTEVCIVPPSADDVNLPRLDFKYIPKQGGLFERLRRGDQGYFYFLASNNDLRNSVELNVTTNLDSRGNLPDGFNPGDPAQAYQSLVYSTQDLRGDFYTHNFVDNPADWQALPYGDPQNNPTSLNKTITLKAGQSKFIPVAMSSFSMCGNGSCNKLSLRLEGEFSDGSPALGCVSTALLVDDVPATSSRHEIHDMIKTGPNSAAIWTQSIYYDEQFQAIPHSQTHFAGNANPLGQRQTSMSADESRDDYVRFHSSVTPRAVTYNASFSSQVGFGINLVTVVGLPEETGVPKAIPAIFRSGVSQLRVVIDCETDSIRLYVGEQLLHAGTYSGFLENPPPDFSIDTGSCRTFTKTADPDVPEICTDKYYFRKLVRDGFVSDVKTIQVYDQLGRPLQGTVEITGDAANYMNLQSTSFTGQFGFTLAQNLPVSPERVTGLFSISSSGTLSDRLIPIVLAQLSRISLTFNNELDLLNAIQIANARGGYTDLFAAIPTSAGLSLTNLSAQQDGPSGDFLTVEGDIQSPFPSPPSATRVRQNQAAATVTIDASECPAPCSLFTFTGDNNSIRGIRFQNFPETAVAFVGDSNSVVTGEFVGNGGAGLRVMGNGNVIGGSQQDGNLFADNGGSGLLIESGTGNAVLFNTFSNNEGLGIDLGGDGVTDNDPDDSDEGANNLQNFPVLTNVQVVPTGGTLIEGTINSAATDSFTLHFYVNSACDPSGNGEGEKLLGNVAVATDANGAATFSVTVDSASTVGQFVTATATDRSGNTSEFSACFEITTAVAVEDDPLALPAVFSLSENYPNPFNPETAIQYAVPKASRVRITIYNVLGQLVRTLIDEQRPAGFHGVTWDGRSDAGTPLASGLFVYRMEAEGFVQMHKMLMIK